MKEYHGIIVDASQKDLVIIKNLEILGSKKSEDGEWVMHRIKVNPDEINKRIQQLQDNLKKGFYFHLYRENELIVVFKEKIFKVKADKNSWEEIIEYGKSISIPEEQLDFWPCRFEDETY